MELSHEQRELLSAFLDGEVNAAERALAQALLERREATQYLAELKHVRALAQSHAQARAPQDLALLVRQSLDGDFDSISRPTSQREGAPLRVMPAANWRTPLMALAAAVVVAVGLFAYDLVSSPARPASTAGEVARQQPAAANPQPETLSKFKRGADEATRPEPAKPAPPPSAQPAAPGQSAPSEDAITPDASDARDEFGKAAEKEYAAKKPESNRRTRGTDSKDAEGSDDGKNSKDTAQGVGGGGGPTSKTGAGEPAKPKAEERKHDDLGGDNERGSERARELSDREHEEVEVVVESTAKSGKSALVTELLQLGNLYGDAESAEDGSVEVEVPQDQLEELMAAVERLTREQSLGSVTVPERANSEEQPQTRTARDALKRENPKNQTRSDTRAQDYLPAELKGALDDKKPRSDDSDDQNAGPAKGGDIETPGAAIQGGSQPKVRVRIRTK